MRFVLDVTYTLNKSTKICSECNKQLKEFHVFRFRYNLVYTVVFAGILFYETILLIPKKKLFFRSHESTFLNQINFCLCKIICEWIWWKFAAMIHGMCLPQCVYNFEKKTMQINLAFLIVLILDWWIYAVDSFISVRLFHFHWKLLIDRIFLERVIAVFDILWIFVISERVSKVTSFRNGINCPIKL